ncbi:MAG: MnmC family methyltransferase [Sulfurimonas sp.]|uniref:tRNA (5-methylaminomethyl-2-thiouridine)(34)-methyltransferase MnmD n=1 Tax=Sulfurimonas sp. TaxID=2022749 RepID=UPI0026017A67|nr:MnmC family methyltransferase [Sulfurimonas sp.]MCW8895543.1 MnmC family methyltransferase [Sulfurimonas sp.]MCW8954705.1 MnmC family methyltransferase [Sulfurimonas sp.]MCW9067979.1 MnmC family methyltransferase [Sulfurimonas sp.]
MSNFDDEFHKITLSGDGSYTAYSKEYDEHYHSTKDGALSESLYKHVYPAFKIKQNKESINILDICFGLGFNTLATVYHHKKNNLTCKLNIFSPELDASLVKALVDFTYPKEFDEFGHIILELVNHGSYTDEYLHVELFLGDAREYVKKFENKFDIVYQDAFSPSTNQTLWTKEYFNDIKNSMKQDGVLTTYSTALATRLALYENGFNVYVNSGKDFRNATVASLKELDEFVHVDMKHKISCNPHVKPLMD